jgi:linoleoyl-CoA desaturase
VVLFWFFGSYAALLALDDARLQAPLCVAYALAACALGFNLFHDSIHGSLSDSPRRNLAFARLACVLLGASRALWAHKHNVLHHRFTNVFQFDDDLETRGSLRLSPRQPWEPKYRGQQLFFPLLYSLTTLEWIFVKDFAQYATGRMNPWQAVPPMSRAEKAEFWACKAAYLGLFVGLPFAFQPAGKVVAGLLLFHLTLGLSLALIFNLAHAMEASDFPVPGPGSPATLDSEWAAHQMRTTVNFATANRWLGWFAGGLNFQVEHHLFPLVSHTHYPALSRIVRRTAEEFGLPYHCHPTWRGALASHYRMLRRLGRRDG